MTGCRLENICYLFLRMIYCFQKKLMLIYQCLVDGYKKNYFDLIKEKYLI